MSDALAPTSLTRALAARLLRRDLGGAWRIANGGGSHGNTRRAARGDLSVVVKLGQPASALRRLAELEVTPPILAWGEHDGSPYTVQRLVAGHHPDPAWFAAHLTELAELIRRYQRDERLAELLREDPSRDRLDVGVRRRCSTGSPRGPARRCGPTRCSRPGTRGGGWRRRWRRSRRGRSMLIRMGAITSSATAGCAWWTGMRSTFPTPSATPASSSGGTCPCRAGMSSWPSWASLDGTLTARILWWTGFKALRNGYWVDVRGDSRTAELNARGLVRAMARLRHA